MEHLPVCLSLKKRTVLIAGGGLRAARRATLVLKAGARVRVYAPELKARFCANTQCDHIEHFSRYPEPEDFKNVVLVFAASDDDAADLRVNELARAAQIPVNIADKPELCTFILPAIVDRSPLLISVSTGGSAPVLARVIKARLETLYPAAYGHLTRFAGTFRHRVTAMIKDAGKRLRFWHRIIDGTVADLVLAGDEAEAETRFVQALSHATAGDDEDGGGEVYLVGAGPGDPDLLTFRAMRLIQRADVVLYDRLIGQGLLDLVRRDAELIYVGKLPKEHTVQQEELSQMLARLAREGKVVVRLKGGDPFMFGRGGEEIEVLAEEGIPFQVVPGITAAAGCASYAGIPLTHRDHAQACVFVTGHGKGGKGRTAEVDLDWPALIQPHLTVCVYMGLGQLETLSQSFIAHGADPALPVAVVDKGTRRDQKVVTGTLTTIASRVADARLAGPAMTIIGTVVTLHDKLAWFNPERREKSLLSMPGADALPDKKPVS